MPVVFDRRGNGLADLGRFPAGNDVVPLSKKAPQLTIGDLHGNALKLLYFLVREGVAQLKKSDYDDFLEIYRASRATKDQATYLEKTNPPLTATNLAKFHDILGRVTISQQAKDDPNFVVRLIGDEVADRGANDYLTLRIFDQLRMNKLQMEFLFSNHGVEFIEALEAMKEGMSTEDSKDAFINFQSTNLEISGQVNSLTALQKLVYDGHVSIEEVKRLYQESYKPFFKALSYTLSEDGSEISLYTHAPVGLDVVQALAAKLNVNYDASTAENLARSIDGINVEFKKHVDAGTVKSLYNQSSKDNPNTTLNDPFALLMWHREDHEKRAEDGKPPRLHVADQTQPAGYRVNYVHGHDSKSYHAEREKYIYNLNGRLGQFEGETSDDYAILKAVGRSQLTLVMQQAKQQQGRGVINYPQPSVSTSAEQHAFQERQLQQLNEQRQQLMRIRQQKLDQLKEEQLREEQLLLLQQQQRQAQFQQKQHDHHQQRGGGCKQSSTSFIQFNGSSASILASYQGVTRCRR